jgi:hypothetical protein
MFVGSLYFNKISFVKTGLVICAAFVLLYGINIGIAQLMFTNVSDAFPYSHVSISLPSDSPLNEFAMAVRPKTEEGNIGLPSPYIDVFRTTVRYILTSVLCVTAFIRLREKEF